MDTETEKETVATPDVKKAKPVAEKTTRPKKAKAVAKRGRKPVVMPAGFVRLDFRVPKTLKKKLDAKAKTTRRTITSLIVEMLEKLK